MGPQGEGDRAGNHCVHALLPSEPYHQLAGTSGWMYRIFVSTPVERAAQVGIFFLS
jgi:hypothetical protein